MNSKKRGELKTRQLEPSPQVKRCANVYTELRTQIPYRRYLRAPQPVEMTMLDILYTLMEMR